MATIMRLSLSLCALTLVCFVSSVNAEDYISKDVPSDGLVLKAAQTIIQQATQGAKAEKVIGKRKDGEDKYIYYLSTAFMNHKSLRSVVVERLDTNIWIMDGKAVVQK
jgi:hypothetical protein